ncbi:MAG: recombinase family protein [Candidatus Woesebacteria bacterium]|nr:recombinase family protein [Candidatus Woesebacteria bacterium]
MENGNKIRAVIYTRVSTTEQAQGKISIPEQIESCKKAIVDRGWELVNQPYIDSGISGHLLEERKGLQDLLRDARLHKFDLVVVKDFDRFARNRALATIVREELKELFIQTHALNTPVEPKDPKTYDPTDDDLGIMVEGYSDTMSEIERNKIRRRMMMGKLAVAKDGRIPNNVPYGYKIKRYFDTDGRVKRKILVNEEEAKIVRWIFDQYIKGKGTLQIAFNLTQKGVKPHRAPYWRKQGIIYMLQNSTYAGKVNWGWRHADYKKNKIRRQRGHQGISVKGKHEAIISETTFNLAQKEKKLRGTTQNGRAKMSRGLLTGIAKCIRCGSGVTYVTRHHKRSRKNPKWHDTTTHEYLCSGHKYSGICQNRVMSADKLESFVMGQIKNLINNPTARERLVFDRNVKLDTDLHEDSERASRYLSEIPRKLQKQQEAYEAGLITLEEYGIAVKRLREEENKYHVVTGDYQIKVQQLNERREGLEKFTKSLEDFDTLWDNSILEEKKHFLRSIIKEVRAGNGNVEIDFRF